MLSLDAASLLLLRKDLPSIDESKEFFSSLLDDDRNSDGPDTEMRLAICIDLGEHFFVHRDFEKVSQLPLQRPMCKELRADRVPPMQALHYFRKAVVVDAAIPVGFFSLVSFAC